MATQQDKAFQLLKEGSIIGPEHHRFKLKGTSTPYPLGEMWLAEDLTTNGSVEVTLFFIAPTYARHKGLQAAFKKQIIRSKSLTFQHIASVIGYFVHNNALLFFATEKLDGITLDSLIREKKIQKLQAQQKEGLLKQTAAAIDFLSKKNMQPHGAIGPDTIYVNRQGGVKLLPLNPKELLAETSFSLSPEYQYPACQSPEAFYPNMLPQSSDVYSLACITYATFSGVFPFLLSEDESARVRKELKAPGKLSSEQWKVIQKAMTTNPDERPQNCIEFVNQLFKKEAKENTDETAIEHSQEEDASTNDSSTPLKTSSNKLTNKKGRTWLIPAAIFLTGFITGLGISFLFFFQQQSINNDELTAWKDQAKGWKNRAEEQSLALQALEEKLNQLEQTASTSAQARQDEGIDNNFEVFKDSLDNGEFGPAMISVPAGSFTMGDTTGEGDDNEKPTKLVNIPQPFGLSKYEVTFEEYDLFAKATNRKMPDDNGWGRGKQPVINVSWRDAKAYTVWLTKQTGQTYRLPNEAEWEYAARSGTSTAYWWGNELSSGMAVCDECEDGLTERKAMPIGSFEPNPWGFHDLNGNVDEWVQDCYTDSLANYPADGSANKSLPCSDRSMRGGSWFDIGRVIRSASRYRHPEEASRNTWGFRVAVDLGE